MKQGEYCPDNYEPYVKSRKTGYGGVLLLVHKSIISEKLADLDADCEMVWAKIHLRSNRDLLVGCFYMPHRKENDLKELEKSLAKIRAGKDKQIILGGDFNCPDINWENGTVSGSTDTRIQEKLVEITEDSMLTQIHDEPTRQNNTIDLIFASNPSLVKFSKTVPGCCDHSAVVADFETRPQRVKEKPRKTHLFSKVNWQTLNEELKPLNGKMSTMVEEGKDVNHLWETFKGSIKEVVDRHVPSVLRKKKDDLPWLNGNIRRMLRKKKRLFKRAKKSHNWADFRFTQKQCRRAMRKAEQQYINNMIEKGMADNNTKPFWRYVKSRRQDGSGVAPLKNGTSLITDSVGKAKILLKQFVSVFTRNDGDQTPPIKGQMFPKIDELIINENGVCKLMKNLNASKASGPDGLPSHVLKNCAEVLAAPLTIIFRHSMATGSLPQDWLTANVSCIFKKGDKHCAENYRPVSLTSVACKLMEHVICHHMHEHFEKHKILTEKNHGFRAGYSCETQLLSTMDDLLKTNDAGIQTDVVILDFSKAFDTVPHKKLLFKLNHYGINGPIHQWITTFLTKRTMRVALEGEFSDSATVESGVPQGTVLGPLLFLCHINDLPVSVESKVRLFADDCLLYREIHTFQDHLTLQKDLQSLEKWASDWGMKFNAKKCYVMPTKTHSPFFYSLCGEILQSVNHNPYLGVELSSDLKWSTHISNKCKKASSLLGFLRRNLGNCPPQCRRLAYISLIRSTLEYGAIVWDPYLKKDVDRLERTQRQAARFIKRDYKSRDEGCVTRMLQDLNLPLLQQRRKQQRLAMFYKIAEGKVAALPPEKVLIPIRRTRRKIIPKTHTGYETTNIIAKYAINNSRGFKIPENKGTEQYTSSFFVQTTVDWNHLPESVVQARTVAAFTAAVCREATEANLQ
jgi:hypothetical protein